MRQRMARKAGAWAIPDGAGQAREGWLRQVTPEDTPHASSRAAPQLGRAGFIFTLGKVHKYEGINSTHRINETLEDCD